MVSYESTTESVSDIAEPDAEPPEHAAGRAQMRAILEMKVGELPDAFRTVFVMRSVEELSVEETADVLGLTEETVRSRHFRARGLLRPWPGLEAYVRRSESRPAYARAAAISDRPRR